MNETKKIIIPGGSGYLGHYLAKFFEKLGYSVVILSRKEKPNEGNISCLKWDGATIDKWMSEFEGAEAVINLTGKSVDCRYNEKNKKEILSSRLNATRAVGLAIQQCKNPPKVWLNAASATIYRHSEDKDMDEIEGEIGTGFSVEVCKAWEKTFYDLETERTRKIALRIAIVLGAEGGALIPLLNLVKIGMGGKQGNGNQYFSWIHIADFAAIIVFILANENINGNINCASHNPLINKEIMQTMRKTWGIKIGIPIPKFLLEIGAILIQTETELILKSRRVVPKRLLDAGFHFKYPDLDNALKNIKEKL